MKFQFSRLCFIDLSRNLSTSSSNCSDLSSTASTRSDEDSSAENYGQGRRNRTIFTKKQAAELERVFQTTHYPDLKCRHEISKVTKLSENRIQVNISLFLYLETKLKRIKRPECNRPLKDSHFRSTEELIFLLADMLS